MEPTKSIWINGELKPWNDAKVHALTHTLHYGGGAFEGIRCYKTDRGPAIFRLREHMERLEYSAKVLHMPLKYSVDQMIEAAREVVRDSGLEHSYIRPLVTYGYGIMGLNPRDSKTDTIIAAWGWGKYLAHDAVDVKVSSYIRIHPRSTVPDAKLCGNYVNSILAVLELKGTKYQEALFMDADGFVAEGPGENLFILVNGRLFTPSKGSILPGITRATVTEMARDQGFEVIEKQLTLDEVLAADEAFFTGTAAEVTVINSINDRAFPKQEVAKRLQQQYLDVTEGRNPRYHKFLTWVHNN